RLRQKSALVVGIARVGAESLVIDVVGAERIAVHEKRRHSVKLDESRVGEQSSAAVPCEAFAHQHIPVALHEVEPYAALRDSAQRSGDRGVEGFPDIVVAYPVLEE